MSIMTFKSVIQHYSQQNYIVFNKWRKVVMLYLYWSSNGVKEEAEVQIDDGREDTEDPDTMYQ